MKLKSPFQIQTPAKINTLLYILAKRPDGFHNIYSHCIPISLFDTLTFTANKQTELVQFGRNVPGKHEDNLILRAVKIFEATTNIAVHLRICLEKQIPFGAGLGGGSANAAGTLRALNHYYQTQLSRVQLIEMATILGSDVPFFLFPQPAIMQGRGEQLTPLENYPILPILLAKPPFSIATTKAYRICQPKMRSHFPQIQHQEALRTEMFNQFAESLFSSYPSFQELSKILYENGAFAATISGSGSAIFGVYQDQQTCQQAFRKLATRKTEQWFTCNMLSVHHYFP